MPAAARVGDISTHGGLIRATGGTPPNVQAYWSRSGRKLTTSRSLMAPPYGDISPTGRSVTRSLPAAPA